MLFQGRYPSDWTEHLLAGWLASLADPTEPASSLNYIQKYLLPLILSLSCGARVTRCTVQLPSPRPTSRVSSVPWADGGIAACGTRLTLRIRCATVLRCVSGPKQPKSLTVHTFQRHSRTFCVFFGTTSRTRGRSRFSYIHGTFFRPISSRWCLLTTVLKVWFLILVRKLRSDQRWCINAPSSSRLRAVKLLVFLTLPADASAKNVTEQRRYISHTLENLLQRREIFPILFSCLSGPLERLESSNLQLKDDDGKTIQLFLTFIRNCLLTDERHKLCTDVKFTCHVKVLFHTVLVLESLQAFA